MDTRCPHCHYKFDAEENTDQEDYTNDGMVHSVCPVCSTKSKEDPDRKEPKRIRKKEDKKREGVRTHNSFLKTYQNTFAKFTASQISSSSLRSNT